MLLLLYVLCLYPYLAHGLPCPNLCSSHGLCDNPGKQQNERYALSVSLKRWLFLRTDMQLFSGN
jgi:hypothetical protein